MFQLRRNRVLVVLVLMSIFVVTTQAFTIDSKLVVIDFQYDQWDGAGLALDNVIQTSASADDYTLQFDLTNTGPTDTFYVRVEMVNGDGTRRPSSDPGDDDPNVDAQWLVATDSILIANGVTETTGVFSFSDSTVSDAVISEGGGYYMVFTDTRDPDYTVSEEYLHARFDVDPYVPPAVPETIRPSAAADVVGSWTGFSTPGDYAWDENDLIATVNAGSDVTDTISFTTWNEPIAAITQVDLNVKFQLVTTATKGWDVITITLVIGANSVVLGTADTSVNTAVTQDYLNVADITGDGWDAADIGNIQIRFTGVKTSALDALTTYDIFEVWGTVNP